MTVQIDGYTVEIKARGPQDGRFNKSATQAIINTIALLSFMASEAWDARGCHSLAKGARRDSSALHETLASQGYYNDTTEA